MTLRFTSSVATDWITVRSGTPGGAVLAFGQTPLVFANTFTGTIYAHWSTNNVCGTQNTCRTTTVQCTVCAPPPPAPCTNASSFGSAAINPAGTVVTISGCSFAGEYSTISGAVSGQALRFTSSVATDMITIHSGTPAGPVLAFGTTPLSFANTFTGTVYAHWNTPGCGSQFTCRTTTVQCTSCAPCLPVTITPPAATICAGSVLLLTASHSNPPVPGTSTTNSGNINLPILDVATVSSTMAVSNVPAGAVVNAVSVNFNITHTWDSDLILSLKAPNNQVLNLVNQRGGAGDNFTNTTISSASVVSLATGTPPFTGTFMADGNAALPPVGFTQTSATFPALYTTPNGNWSFGIRDAVGGDVGTLINWSVTIDYNAPILPVWAPLTELYTDAAGTIPYTGTPSATVYAAPTVTRTYSATLVTASCTGAPTFVTITTNPAPAAPTITPNPAGVCPGGIRRLDATSGATPVAVIWAPITELFTDAAATIAYTGTPLTTIYTRPSVARTYTAVIPGTPCPSLPASVLVSIFPNPPVVIIADPGSVLCEGDPALLTVRLGTSSPTGTLYNQPGAAGNGSPSQVFEPANVLFNSQSADDFTVPAGTTWTVTSITANGIGGGAPTSVNVFFYNNSAGNLPGTVVATFNNVLSFTRAGGNYNVTLPSSVLLGAGTYWVCLQVNMSFATGGQWFWGNFGTTNIGNQYAWQNPGGGFGTPCTSWGYGKPGPVATRLREIYLDEMRKAAI